mgnify:CR=1 FL=1
MKDYAVGAKHGGHYSAPLKHEDRVRAHDALRASATFKEQETRFNRLIRDFAQAFVMGRVAATRNTFLCENSLTLQRADDIAEAAVSIQALVAEGMHNPARREERYAIESLVKYLLIDQRYPTALLSERLGRFGGIERGTIGMVDDIVLFMLKDEVACEFRGEVKSEYARLCRYVHASSPLLRERLSDARRGAFPGLESVRQFESMNRELTRFFDLCLTLLFHAIGSPETGDAFIQVFDDDAGWKFHRTKFMRHVSAHFDYKTERARRPQPGSQPRGDSRREARG